MLKHFEPQDFDKFDVAARNVARSFWERLGYTCIDNDDIYAVDLLVERNGKLGLDYRELETRNRRQEDFIFSVQEKVT